MSSSKLENKEIFSKIRSKVNRNEVFLASIKEKTSFICKGVNDALFYFMPSEALSNGTLKGTTKLIEGVVAGGELVANFGAAGEKYFYRTTIDIANSPYVLSESEELFKLQRRSHFRVELSSASEKSIILIGLNQKKIFIDAECLDFSAGGARMMLSKKALKLKVGDKIIPVIRINGKRFEVEAEIRHIKEEKENLIAGIQFSETDTELSNRLHVLVLEFQRTLTSSL